MKNFRQRFHQLSVTIQLILIIFLLIIPFNLLSLSFAFASQTAYLEQASDSAQHTLNLYLNLLDERIYSSDWFFADDLDTNIRALNLRSHEAGTDYMVDAVIYWQELYDHVKNYMEADAYFYYLENEDYVNAAVNPDIIIPGSSLKAYIRENAVDNRQAGWFVDEIDGEYWLIHISDMSGFYYGSMISLNVIIDEITENLGMDGSQVLLDIGGDISAGNGQLLVSGSASGADVTLCVLLDRQKLLGHMPRMQQAGIILVIAYLLCVPILILIIHRLLINPMKSLDHAMDELQSGNLDYRMTGRGSSREMDTLNRRYNSMAENLKNLKIQVYEQELEKLDVEATNLRLQVNPHFILNSLNIIFSFAKSGKTMEIRQFTRYLSEYLRFSLWHTEGSISLREELKCVENYMQIQKMRFPGSFTYMENIEEDVYDVQVPSLLVLNFVENTIKYGLIMGSEIEILVLARAEEGTLVLSVCDSGCGMDSATLEVLQNGEILEKENKKHIGIWNCRRRLAVKYDGRAHLNITSTEGEGTQVFIRLPIEEG